MKVFNRLDLEKNWVIQIMIDMEHITKILRLILQC